MPWHIEASHPDCSGFAVVKDDTGELEGCHDTEAEAKAQLAALYASEENAMGMTDSASGTASVTVTIPVVGENREVDESAWDGNTALGACSTAADYRSICAGERTVGEPDERQHWALPHHYLGKGPNAAGVRNALARLPQTQGLANKQAAQDHLDTHMNAINPDRAAQRETYHRQIQRVRRKFPSSVEVRSEQGYNATVIGYAAIFERGYNVIDFFGDYEETVASSAFDKTLAEGADVRYFFDHEGLTLARTKPGTLKLSTDDEGLHYEATIDRRQTVANDLAIAIERGDVDQSSFAFRTLNETWSDNFTKRRLTELKLYDVSSVAFPMNEDTTAGLRDGAWLEEIAFNAHLFAELRSGDILPPPSNEILDAAIEALKELRAPELLIEPVEATELALTRHRLDVLKLREPSR